MVRKLVYIFLFISTFNCFSQYDFSGQVAEKTDGKTIYLSLIDDYRKLGRISMEQIFKKTTTDSLGFFKFTGDNLDTDNRIYRIHIDECSDTAVDSEHFFGSCQNSRSILFIANNRDTITFPTSFADEALCEITSTNEKSSAFLKIDILKDEMAYDFHEFRSDANRKLNSKKWFPKLQEFGKNLNEPLAELYVYDFLSDKRNETYSYYQKDINQTNYYTDLAKRLKNKYPNTPFTNLYVSEISIDQQVAAKHTPKSSIWKWIIPTLLVLSLLFNVFLLLRKRSIKKTQKALSLHKLTEQEQNIVKQILKGKTNKEIASELFISLSTVKTHINNLYKKLDVSSREEIKKLF